jgi:hypothetical protein
MTPQEKLPYFWPLGELPGTIFDDLNDRKPKVPEQPRRRQTKRLQLGSRKRRKETSIRNGSRIGLEQSG